MFESKIKKIENFAESYLKVTFENVNQKITKIAQCVKIKLKTEDFALPYFFLIVNIYEKNKEFVVIVPSTHPWFFKIRQYEKQEVIIQKILGQGLEKNFFENKKMLVITEETKMFELQELLNSTQVQATSLLKNKLNYEKEKNTLNVNKKETVDFLKISTKKWKNEIQNILKQGKNWDFILINTSLVVLKELEKILWKENKIIFLFSFLGFSCGSKACYGCILKVQEKTKYLRVCEAPILFVKKKNLVWS